MLESAGVGLTVTVVVNVEPGQAPAAPEVGVTVYTIFCGALVVLVNVPDTEAAADPAAIPVMVAEVGADQAYVVPAGIIVAVGLLVGVTVNVPPSQIVAV